MSTAPAPIMPAARPAWLAFSDSSALASANSLPTSFASWPTASLRRSGIDRLLGEAIAVSLVDGMATSRVHARSAVAAHPVAARAVAAHFAGPTASRCFRRTLQKPHSPEPGQHCHSKKCSRLPTCEALCAAYEIVEVSVPDRIGDALDLRSRLADVSSCYRQVVVKLAGCAAHRVRKTADIFGADILLTVDGLFELVRRLRRSVFCGVDKLGGLVFYGLGRSAGHVRRLVLEVACGRTGLIGHAAGRAACFLEVMRGRARRVAARVRIGECLVSHGGCLRARLMDVLLEGVQKQWSPRSPRPALHVARDLVPPSPARRRRGLRLQPAELPLHKPRQLYSGQPQTPGLRRLAHDV